MSVKYIKINNKYPTKTIKCRHSRVKFKKSKPPAPLHTATIGFRDGERSPV